MEYGDGKMLEKRYRDLFALKTFQNLNDQQRDRLEHEISMIKTLLPDDVINEIERQFQHHFKLSTEEKIISLRLCQNV